MNNLKSLNNLFFALCIGSAALITSCSEAAPNAEQEAVWVKKPMFFGHGGVDPVPVSTGRSYGAPTTDVVYFKIVPMKYQEVFDDIFSNDNTPLDFNSNIVIQIKKGHTPVLLENYGENWYENNIREVYRNMTRDQVSKYSPFDLTSNREVLAQIDAAIIKGMNDYIERLSKEREFPIIVKNVITGKATPNRAQLDEMNRTAAAIQAAKTQERKREMEMAREAAEKQRAIADKAYMNEMNLTANQFIQLRAWDIIEKKEGANIDVLFDGSTEKMWNIKRK